jgi:DNA polymerase-3 subunit beta
MFDQPPPPATSLRLSAARLLTICRQLAPAYQARNTIPVLGTALLQAGPDGATFTITDLDMQVTVTADDLISAEPWTACIPFGLLRRLAASLDGLVTIAFAEGGPHPAGKMDQLTLSTEDGFSATINLMCTKIDFPTLPDHLKDEAWHDITMSPADLRRFLNLTIPCVSTEETRYYLNGVHLCRKPGGSTLRTVATDGHRLAVIDGAIEAPEGTSAILPTVAVRAMLSLVSHKSNDPVIFRLNRTATSGGATRMRLDHGTVRIDCKLIDGTFPDYTRVMPQNATRGTLTLTAATLRRLSAIMTERAQAVAFRDGRATIKSPDIEGEISVPAPMEMADPVDRMEIGFNLRLILAQARMTATFRMELLGPSDPARIRAEDPDALWVIMPMRV